LSIFGFTSNLTLVWHVPARNKAVIPLSSQHCDNMCKGKEKDHKCPIIKHNKATKSGFDILEEDGRECTCVRSRRHFLSFVDVVCVNIFILWMLKYPNWQEKKNH